MSIDSSKFHSSAGSSSFGYEIGGDCITWPSFLACCDLSQSAQTEAQTCIHENSKVHSLLYIVNTLAIQQVVIHDLCGS